MVKEETIRSKPTEDLVSIFCNPTDWIPEAVEWATDELRKREVRTDGLSVKTPDVIAEEQKVKKMGDNINLAKFFGGGIFALSLILFTIIVVQAISEGPKLLSQGEFSGAAMSAVALLFALSMGWVGFGILRGKRVAARVGFWLSIAAMVMSAVLFLIFLIAGEIAFGLIFAFVILLLIAKGLKAMESRQPNC